MEREYRLATKVFMILSLVYASSSAVGAARPLMSNEEKSTTVVQPQNWPGFTFPSPGFTFPSPGFALPSPSFAFPSPGFAFPSPGFAFPSPGFNFGQPGAGSICILFPTSAGCGQARPTTAGGLLGGGSP